MSATEQIHAFVKEGNTYTPFTTSSEPTISVRGGIYYPRVIQEDPMVEPKFILQYAQKNFEISESIEFSQRQQEYITEVVSKHTTKQRNCSILSGKPGTGKTTTMNAIANQIIFSDHPVVVFPGIPTGKELKFWMDRMGDTPTLFLIDEMATRLDRYNRTQNKSELKGVTMGRGLAADYDDGGSRMHPTQATAHHFRGTGKLSGLDNWARKIANNGIYGAASNMHDTQSNLNTLYRDKETEFDSIEDPIDDILISTMANPKYNHHSLIVSLFEFTSSTASRMASFTSMLELEHGAMMDVLNKRWLEENQSLLVDLDNEFVERLHYRLTFNNQGHITPAALEALTENLKFAKVIGDTLKTGSVLADQITRTILNAQ